MPQIIKKNINTPKGVSTIESVAPQEGEIFTNWSGGQGGMGDLYIVKNGRVVQMNAQKFLLSKRPELAANFASQYTNQEQQWNAVKQELAKEGIDFNNIPKFNLAVVLEQNPELRMKSGTNSDGSDWNFKDSKGGDYSGFTNSGDRPYTEEEKKVIFGTAKAEMRNPQTGEVQQTAGADYVPQLNQSAQPNTNSTQPGQGYLPGYKGVYKGKENLMANKEAVNELFKQYHGRDANAQEIQYWTQKKVGDLEDTLAKTTIFSKEDADKIRAQMMAQGLTAIPNQAELEKLGSGAGVTLPPNTGSMLFQPTNTGSGASGASGTGSGTGSGSGSGASGTGSGASGSGAGSGDPSDNLADTVANAVGDPNAGEDEILAALEKIKTGQVDPYYKQLISQAQQDITTSINRSYEDRIRQLQSESFNLSENIQNTQKSLAGKGLTFSGEAIKQLGTLSAFAQGTPAGLTPTQLGQDGQPLGGNVVPGQTLPAPATGIPTMTAAQMGLEGSTNLANRLTAESTRSKFNQGLEDIGTNALRLLGSQGVSGLGLPANAGGGTPTTGTMQYDYARTLQNLYGGLGGQSGELTDYQRYFL